MKKKILCIPFHAHLHSFCRLLLCFRLPSHCLPKVESAICFGLSVPKQVKGGMKSGISVAPERCTNGPFWASSFGTRKPQMLSAFFAKKEFQSLDPFSCPLVHFWLTSCSSRDANRSQTETMALCHQDVPLRCGQACKALLQRRQNQVSRWVNIYALHSHGTCHSVLKKLFPAPDQPFSIFSIM